MGDLLARWRPKDRACLKERCECCRSWTHHLAILRDHIREHTRGERRRKPCNSECLVCAEVGWQGGLTATPPAADDG